MLWIALFRDTETVQRPRPKHGRSVRDQAAHNAVTLTEAAMHAPRGNDERMPAGLADDGMHERRIVRVRIVLGRNRMRCRFHLVWISAAEREEVQHHERAHSFALRETDAAANRGVVSRLVGGARIEPDDDEGRQTAVPCPRERVAIRTVVAECR